MLRVAMAEDSTADRKQLCQYLERFSRESGEKVQVTAYADGMALLEQYRPAYDLVLLDIEMPHLDGMDTARELRKLDARVLLMFITNMAQYALKGYEVDALDYVLKPVSYYAFAMKLRRVLRILREQSRQDLMLPFDGALRRVPVSSVLYVEVRDHKLCYHTYDGDSLVTGSMRAAEQSLAGQSFARCNNCYLVNLKHVQRVTQEEVWVEQTPLKISRPRRKAFMEALSAYYGGGGR